MAFYLLTQLLSLRRRIHPPFYPPPLRQRPALYTSVIHIIGPEIVTPKLSTLRSKLQSLDLNQTAFVSPSRPNQRARRSPKAIRLVEFCSYLRKQDPISLDIPTNASALSNASAPHKLLYVS